MADILLIIYIIFFVLVCICAATPTGKEIQQEYMAFKSTQKYMHSKGLRWPPREGLD